MLSIHCICSPEQLKAASYSDLFPVPFQLGAQRWQGKVFSCHLLHPDTAHLRLQAH